MVPRTIFAINICNQNKIEAKNNFDKIVKQCNLTEVLNKKIKTLSKGQQQRVSFAQGLIHNPANLILDEPNSGLDPLQIKQLRTFIKELSQTKAILMSLWDVDDKATCKLMMEFYKNWLEGTSKHKALELAKTAVRSTKGWEDPIFWAGFILLDGL